MGVVKFADESKKKAVAARMRPTNRTEASGTSFITHSYIIWVDIKCVKKSHEYSMICVHMSHAK
jgi:hypothetical protein